ncbi:hypothetical protein M419DRAFT_8175 [Trichoderma reesei RUT C-30]|uniref:Uncharacterized protein n=1 Tax=Hypocrea jecorina (strain ATCC 56765 / BCRC 32924 / NRRL 11460 / Rut C-30) TaxID=1344414 RepID=A0A024SBV5_HYPJR|nr:hypothetical protein M419DRAFT_8175 [Trichoderma reesei RUT C-30]
MKSTGSSQRAAEITSAMLSVPGYADDTMLFMMRYGSTARETLRKVDWDEFQVRLSALNKHWFASRSSQHTADGETICTAAEDGTTTTTTTSTISVAAAADLGVEAQAQEASSIKAAELRTRTLELVQDFPSLVRDFDKFVDCTRITAMRYGKGPQ